MLAKLTKVKKALEGACTSGMATEAERWTKMCGHEKGQWVTRDRHSKSEWEGEGDNNIKASIHHKAVEFDVGI